MKRVLLSGYYGFGNLGDEAILEATVNALRAADSELELAVLSADPAATSAAHDVEAAHRARPFSVLREIRRCDLLLSGGGGLIQDATSPRSPRYYLGIMRLAQLVGRRTMVFAQGLGPVKLPRTEALTRSAFRRARAITVRDQASADWLRGIGVAEPEPQVTADMAFLLRAAPDEQADAVLAQIGLSGDQRLLGISVRAWGEHTDYLHEVARATGAICAETGLQPVLLPLHPAQDLPVARRLAESLEPQAVILPTMVRPSIVLALLCRMSLLLGMRLHALVFAALAGVPLVGLSYDPKVDALLDSLGEPPLGPLSTLHADEIVAAAMATWQEREDRKARLERAVADLRESAQANVSAALACLAQ